MFMPKEDKSGKDNERYYGKHTDLIYEMSLIDGFKYTFYDVKSYGTLNANGLWNGIIRELLEKVTYTCVDNY